MGTHLVLCPRHWPGAPPSVPAPKMKLCFAHVNSLLWVWRSSSKSRSSGEMSPDACLPGVLHDSCSLASLQMCYPPSHFPFSVHSMFCCFDSSDAKAPLDHALLAPSQPLQTQSCAHQFLWPLGNRPSLAGPKCVTRIDIGGNNSCSIKWSFLEC